MALIICKDCKKEFSTDAKNCPHCGANPPKPKVGCIPIALVVVVVASLIGALSGSNNAPSTPPPPCQNNWHLCASNSDLVNQYEPYGTARVRCQMAAEKAAKFGEPKFPSGAFGTFYKGDSYIKTGRAVIVEDDAQFQNGFSAMVHSTVTCVYDLNSETVIDLRITEN